MKQILLFSLLIGVGSCTPTPENPQTSEDKSANDIRYAKKFQLKPEGKIIVTEPWPGATHSKSYQFDQEPKRVVVTSTTHLPFMEMLGLEDKLVAFPSTQYISSEKIRLLVDAGKITDLGPDGQLNMELLIGSAPDLVIAFDMGQESTSLDKIMEAGIPVVYNSDYLEPTSLGRAEWLKFFGAIFGKHNLADSLFREIEFTYESLRKIATLAESKPTVFSGVMYGDAWFLPGGKNSSAQFIQDAGGQYLWATDNSNGWIEISFESVLNSAQSADFWIGTATFTNLSELKNADARYAMFDAFQKGAVYSYYKRTNEAGGFDFFESGYARPDRVLADMIGILHPELLPEYESYYYDRLK